MRAWIEPEDHKDPGDDGWGHNINNFAFICEYVDGFHTDLSEKLYMNPKPYTIEYDEEDMKKTDIPEAKKIKVDITGLSNTEVVTLLTLLNANGFEAEIVIAGPALNAGKWYRDSTPLPNMPLTPGIQPYTTNPVGWPPTIISNNAVVAPEYQGES